jgi:mandelate racemase
MKEPHQTASGVVSQSPLVLTDVITDAGIKGHSIIFTYTPAALKPTAEVIRNCEELVKNDMLAPAEIEKKLTKRWWRTRFSHSTAETFWIGVTNE